MYSFKPSLVTSSHLSKFSRSGDLGHDFGLSHKLTLVNPVTMEWCSNLLDLAFCRHNEPLDQVMIVWDLLFSTTIRSSSKENT
jgi:hypothetical protein